MNFSRHYLLFFATTSMNPRFMSTVDENLNPVSASVRFVLSINLPIHLFIYPSVYLYIYLSIYLYIYPSCLPIYLSIYLSIHLIYLFIYPSASLCMYLPISFPSLLLNHFVSLYLLLSLTPCLSLLYRRVGQAVETVGQAGRPKTITGFQVLSLLTVFMFFIFPSFQFNISRFIIMNLFQILFFLFDII